MEAKVFSAKNIVKTGCVYISDHLNLRKIVLIPTTMLLYNITMYFLFNKFCFCLLGVKPHADLLNFRKMFPISSCGFRR